MKKSSIRTWALLGLAALSAAPLALRAEEMDSDMRVRLEAIEEAIDGLNKKAEEFSNVFVEGFVNLRFDDERRPHVNAGQSGIYARRAEFKLSGKLSPTIVYSLGYDFTENKHKDLGVEFRDVPLLLFLDVPGYEWVLRVGQYRMPFGIVPQTSSSAILFPERPMIFGARTIMNASSFAFTNIFAERAMGLQLRQKAKLGSLLAYDLQAGAFNNLTQDQIAGQNRLQTAFTNQVTDQDLSYITRLAFDWTVLNSLLEGLLGKTKIQTGASWAKDGQNTAWMAQLNSQIKHDEYLGVEWLSEFGNKMVIVQSEWIRMLNDINAANGLANNAPKEGWYADLALDFLPMFFDDITKGDSFQLIARTEEQVNFNATASASRFSSLSGGLKWSYLGGKNHSSITYQVVTADGMFGGDYRAVADGGTGIRTPETRLIFQQQFAFETGKP